MSQSASIAACILPADTGPAHAEPMDRPKPVPAFESWEGRVLREKYRVGPKLGAGGWGAVYEAEHLVLGRRVAIKFLHPDVADDPNARERLRREAIAASRTGHPNIIEIIDLDVLPDGREFIVLELLEGRALSVVLAAERALSVRRAHALFVQIADALSAAHRARVVHRDLKPENILICDRGGGVEHVKVLDFGIAKLRSLGGGSSDQDTFTGTGEVLGTPRYMAPEQVRGDPHLDHRADIHALGLIMYECLAGSGPYDSHDLPTFLGRLMHDIPVPLAVTRSDISRPLSDLVQSMLAKDPNKRPQSAADVCAALTRLTETERLSDNPPPMHIARPRPSPQRAPVPVPSDAFTLTADRPQTRASVEAGRPPASRAIIEAAKAAKSPNATLPVRAGSPRVPTPEPSDEPSVVISIEYLVNELPPDDEGATEAQPLLFDPIPKAPRRPGSLRPSRIQRRTRRTLLRVLRRERGAAKRAARWRFVALVVACIGLGAGLAVLVSMNLG